MWRWFPVGRLSPAFIFPFFSTRPAPCWLASSWVWLTVDTSIMSRRRRKETLFCLLPGWWSIWGLAVAAAKTPWSPRFQLSWALLPLPCSLSRQSPCGLSPRTVVQVSCLAAISGRHAFLAGSHSHSTVHGAAPSLTSHLNQPSESSFLPGPHWSSFILTPDSLVWKADSSSISHA